jgi:MFS family permease
MHMQNGVMAMATSEVVTPPARTSDLRNYIAVTAAYWADTLTDGAVRMLVLFYFFTLGYTPFQVASLFLFYEIFGVFTNLFGGWLAARFGLKATLFMGLAIQLLALSMLALVPEAWLNVPFVMVAQAFGGIAKDLTKMSSKSAVKLIVAEDAPSALFKWVAILTGSKNALKGIGFFVGGFLLSAIGFRSGLAILASLVAIALIGSLLFLRGNLGSSNKKAKFQQIFSQNRAVNMLAAARLFLFGARDVWFVVGLPVFLYSVLGWNFWQVGTFLAIWIIGYGMVQASAPAILQWRMAHGGEPDGRTAMWLAAGLALIPAGIALALSGGLLPQTVVVVGLIGFGVIFALNSAVHSYLILAYTDSDKVAMNVGFYYMANAGGRLIGTVLSGLLYQYGVQQSVHGGLIWCLSAAVGFVVMAALISFALPTQTVPRTRAIQLKAEGD